MLAKNAVKNIIKSDPVVIILYRALIRITYSPVLKDQDFTKLGIIKAFDAHDRVENAIELRRLIRGKFDQYKYEVDEVEDKIDFGFKAYRDIGGIIEALEIAAKQREENKSREGVNYKIGEVVRHKTYGHRGIIVGWDKKFKDNHETQQGYLGPELANLREEQPFYHIIPDQNDVLAMSTNAAASTIQGIMDILHYCPQDLLER